MLASYGSAGRPGPNTLFRTIDFAAPPETAFALLREVEKWPVWLSFLRSARLLDPVSSLGLGSEVALRGAIPGEDEELYEVDQFLEGHIVSLVGAYSVRRRLSFRLERKTDRSKIQARIEYPAYGGALGVLIDRWTARRRIDNALEASLEHFRGLAEFRDASRLELTDF